MNKRYTYDGLGRLTQEYNADFGTTFNYSYDNAGNITEKSYEQTNSQGQSEQITKTYAYTNGRLTNYNGYTILYDEIGNPVTCFNNSLEWTHGHRLKKYYGAEFTYNYAGIRLKKTANGKTTKYALEGDKIIAIEQTDGNTTQNMTFYYGVDGVSGFEYDGEQYFYRKNIFGDILGIYKNAELIVKYVYDAWGVNKTYVSDGSNWVLLENSAALDSNSDYARNVRIAKLNPFLYRGYCYDRETRLYYLNARYYDPQVGRFISPDDISYLDPTTINGLNLYAYCGNNPVSSNFSSIIALTNKVPHYSFSDVDDVTLNVPFKKINIGFGLSREHTMIEFSDYHFFYDVAYGVGETQKDNKPINLIATIPREILRFWDYSFGIDFYKNEKGFQIFIGTDVGIGWYNKEGGTSVSFDGSGRFKIVHTKNLPNSNDYEISQFEINTHNIVGTLIACYFAPGIIPVVVRAFAASRS